MFLPKRSNQAVWLILADGERLFCAGIWAEQSGVGIAGIVGAMPCLLLHARKAEFLEPFDRFFTECEFSIEIHRWDGDERPDIYDLTHRVMTFDQCHKFGFVAPSDISLTEPTPSTYILFVESIDYAF